jgi:hypothetical protein
MYPSLLPSWVVDWRCKSSQGTRFDSDGKTTFNACRGYPYRTSSPPSHKNKTLHVRGRVVGEVEVVCPINYNARAAVEQLRLLEIAESLRPTSSLVGHSLPEVSENEWLKRILAVIIAYDCRLDPLNDVEIDKMLRAYQNFDRIIHGDKSLEDRVDLETALRQLTNKMKIYRGKRVFRGAHASLLGLGARGLCRGDLICVLHGSKVPIILRKHASQYTVIGQCYYEKWMYGDLVDWKENEADAFELV